MRVQHALSVSSAKKRIKQMQSPMEMPIILCRALFDISLPT